MIRCLFCERHFSELPDTAVVLRSKPTYVMVQFQEHGKPVHQFSRSDLANPPEPHIEEPEFPGVIVAPAPAQAVDELQEQPEPPTPQPAPWPWAA